VKRTAKLWLGIAVLIVLSPAGLLLPEYFKAGSAWGEWSVEEICAMMGYVPAGMEKLSSIWHAPLPDYAFRGQGETGLARLSFSYILSALAGICLIVLVMMLLGKLLSKKDK
jgi:hypothetical protein